MNDKMIIENIENSDRNYSNSESGDEFFRK